MGAILFIFAIHFEFQIIKKLRKIKKPKSWFLATSLTIFFILGYIVNILCVIYEWAELQMIFGALVFLFGAIFLVLVVFISFKTYSAIFEAAERELGDSLKKKDDE